MTNTNLKQAFQNFRDTYQPDRIYEARHFAQNEKFEKEAIELLDAYGIDPDEYEIKELTYKWLILKGIKNGRKVLITVTMKYRGMGYYTYYFQIRFKVDGKSMKNEEFAKWYNN